MDDKNIINENNIGNDYKFSIKDINNINYSNRKLIINEQYEFWVHDNVLINSSKFFDYLLNQKLPLSSKTRKNTGVSKIKISEIYQNDKTIDSNEKIIKKYKCWEETVESYGKTIVKTYISLPSFCVRFFFDVLIWMYGKDSDRLQSICDDEETFLSMISIGKILKLENIYFKSLLEAFPEDNHEKLFVHQLWSRFYIDFEIVIGILQLDNNYNNTNINTMDNQFIETDKDNFNININDIEFTKIKNETKNNKNTTISKKQNTGISKILNKNEQSLNDSIISKNKKTELQENSFVIKQDLSKNSLAQMRIISNYKILTALFSWLKEEKSNILNETIILNKERELIMSPEFRKVKDLIKEFNLTDINENELNQLIKKFPNHIQCLDLESIFEKKILNENVKIKCRICKMKAISIQDFSLIPCEIKLYHPGLMIKLQKDIANHLCDHENCKSRININEYSCCHKGPFTEGCFMSDGQHIIVIEESLKSL